MIQIMIDTQDLMLRQRLMGIALPQHWIHGIRWEGSRADMRSGYVHRWSDVYATIQAYTSVYKYVFHGFPPSLSLSLLSSPLLSSPLLSSPLLSSPLLSSPSPHLPSSPLCAVIFMYIYNAQCRRVWLYMMLWVCVLTWYHMYKFFV